MKLDEPISLLIVDDIPANLLSLEALIQNSEDEILASSHIVKANSGNEALKLSLQHDYAAILLDVQMPEMDGYETAELLRSNKKTSYIPIIFVTAINKEEHQIFRGYDAGAVDYLFKPIEKRIFLSKIKIFAELHYQRLLIEKQLAELEIAREQLRIKAMYDALTNTYNRGAIFEHLEKEIARFHREHHPLAVALLDIDHFKQVNDIYGHPVGDDVLKEFAQRISESMRPYDLFGRFGGEEFLIIVPRVKKDVALVICERIRNCISATPFTFDRLEIDVTVSIGLEVVEFHPKEEQITPESLLKRVDQALYQAKEDGRNQVVAIGAGMVGS